MVAFLFQQQKAPCHFSLLLTPILLQVFSILLQKGRQYCLCRIQCRKKQHNVQIERNYSNAAIYPDSSWAGVLVDATNRVGCYYVVNIAAKTGKSWWFAQINLNTKNTHLFQKKKESDIEQKYAIYHRRLCFRWEPVKELEPHFKRSIVKQSTQYTFAKLITNVLFTLSLFD